MRAQRRRWWIPLACAAALVGADSAEARALVEPGDLVVGFGAGIVAVRADGGGVAPISPRAGSGPSAIEIASAVAIDAAGSRILAGDPLGRLFVVDPADGSQTLVTDGLGAALLVGQDISAIAALADGSFLVASSALLTVEPSTTYGSGLLHVGPLASDPAPAVSAFAELFTGLQVPPVHGLSVREPGGGGLEIFVSTLTPFGSALSTVNPVTRQRADLAGVPVGSTSFIADTALDCPSEVATDCALYWIESAANASGCVAEQAVVHRQTLTETKPVYVGAPLRCAFALAVGADATLFVFDAESDGANPRIHRFDHDALSDSYAAVRIAESGELPEPMPPSLPRMTVSALALPEPESGAPLVLALAAAGALRRRAAIKP